MQDTGHFTGEVTGQDQKSSDYFGIKNDSFLILASISMKTEEFLAHLMKWVRICALVD